MKHLKKFENFYMNDELEQNPDSENGEAHEDDVDMHEVRPDDTEDEEEDGPPMRSWMRKSRNPRMGEEPVRKKVWGDEVIEKKKAEKCDDSDECTGLTAKQRKLPEGLRKAILKRKKRSKK